MLDATILSETPPLCCCYGHRGSQVCVPVTGGRATRVLHGAVNVRTGEVLMLITKVWDALTHQHLLEMIRTQKPS